MYVLKRKTKIGRGLFALSFLLYLGMIGAPARAQNLNDVQARLSRMENEIQTLSRAMFRGEAPPPDFTVSTTREGGGQAELDVRLSQLETELRGLTGRLEEHTFRLDQIQSRLDKALSDMDMRLKALESQARVLPAPSTDPGGVGMQTVSPYGATGTPPAFSSPPALPAGGSLGSLPQGSTGAFGSAGPSVPPGTSAVGGDDPASAYGRAFATLQSGDHAGAAQAFEAFLARYPEDSLAPNAHYWLGESYYARHDYAQAARVFAEAYRKYPKSAKTADNLLKLGLSLAGQGNKNDACVALAQLRREFPDGTGPVLARAAEESKKLACP